MKHTVSHYAKIECPTCMAMSGEQCRDPKTLKYLGPQTEDLHEKRVRLVLDRDDAREREAAETRENINRALAEGDPRVKEFFRRYEELCVDMRMSLSHEDDHGAFILTDQKTQRNLDWAKSAIQKLAPITDQEKLDLRSQYAEKAPGDNCARRLLLERLQQMLPVAEQAAKAEGYTRLIRTEEFKVLAASIFLDYGDLLEDILKEGL